MGKAKVIHFYFIRSLNISLTKPYPCAVFLPLETIEDLVDTLGRDLLFADPGVPPSITLREGVPNIFK